ncbi:MAG: helix-turn-helix domain-containing protein [Rhodobacteraceae bacterium]|jgi:DNA-binding transcriptional ArsR family regulator/protein-tyrosine-phosphatase|nr:helix-turn-helix domain-containing protein [Paracoccaceae bacterium]
MEHDPVPAFAALAHPQRLEVLRLLVGRYPQSVPAGEIGAITDIKPSTLSGYLAQLAEAGLITQERRGTSLRYALSLDGIERLNLRWIGGICRGRGLPELGAPGPRIRNILFVGHHNAGPSLIAEALFRAQAGARYEVFSAGVGAPGAPDPQALTLLRDRGCDTDLLWSKPLASLMGEAAPRMDAVITLGETARALAPVFAGCPMQAHWALRAKQSARDLFDQLAARLEPFAALDPAATPRAAMQAALDKAPAPRPEAA